VQTSPVPGVQVFKGEGAAENVCRGEGAINIEEIAFNWELGCGAHTSAQLVVRKGMLSAKEEILCE
jgi:hypothetical protein